MMDDDELWMCCYVGDSLDDESWDRIGFRVWVDRRGKLGFTVTEFPRTTTVYEKSSIREKRCVTPRTRS